ncbi:hypothetical protein OV207_19190 [Corallococcus sp. BB11-1]|uniref:hypothetical protein n=1 Tax=Corallococcus sp. BB11-1 TaxID=2996783 RepID=UPI002271BD47|nr:hypothetical protein [Corallococcus sp. BB11-1]MCY1033585.1 hypothetical protein [Corallococcus sp. BB11-1]
MRLALLLGTLLLSSGCVVASSRPSRPPPRPGPPPRPVAMNYDEAVRRGFEQCRSRGYRCELKEAHLTGNNVWKVKLRAYTHRAKGHLHLDYDAYTRNLLKVNDKVKGKGGGRDDDWDDDDDHRGHGRGKKKGHAHRDD